MKLAEYLAQENLTHQEFADRVGLSQAAVSRYIAGTRFPERGILLRIREVTGGAVTPNDFPLLPEQAAAS